MIMRLTIENLTMAYRPHVAVDDISFNVPDGRLTAILGPSGCGKSTLLSGIAGIRRPESGIIGLGDRILFSSSEKTDIPPEKRRIGFVFQNYALWPHMTVNKIISYPLWVKRERPDVLYRERRRILSLIRLEEKGERYPGELSGGERQRVALGRALIMNPDLLLLDEPLSNLDARLREDMQEEIRRIQRSLGLTVVHVTHDQSEALAMSDEVIIMDAGRIVQKGRPEEIYEKPNSLFTVHFVGTGNIIEEDKDMVTIIRPEDIAIRKFSGDESILNPNNAAGRTGIVVEKIYRGAHFLYIVKTPAGELKIQTHPAERFDIGDKVLCTAMKTARVSKNL